MSILNSASVNSPFSFVTVIFIMNTPDSEAVPLNDMSELLKFSQFGNGELLESVALYVKDCPRKSTNNFLLSEILIVESKITSWFSNVFFICGLKAPKIIALPQFVGLELIVSELVGQPHVKISNPKPIVSLIKSICKFFTGIFISMCSSLPSAGELLASHVDFSNWQLLYGLNDPQDSQSLADT